MDYECTLGIESSSVIIGPEWFYKRGWKMVQWQKQPRDGLRYRENMHVIEKGKTRLEIFKNIGKIFSLDFIVRGKGENQVGNTKK